MNGNVSRGGDLRDDDDDVSDPVNVSSYTFSVIISFSPINI